MNSYVFDRVVMLYLNVWIGLIHLQASATLEGI
jgi:hypothetical protein